MLSVRTRCCAAYLELRCESPPAMAAAATCSLAYNPLEGDHERGGGRKRRSSMTALVEEGESCAALTLPCVAPLAGPSPTATSPGPVSARSARSKSSLASLPDVGSRKLSMRSMSSAASSPRWLRGAASGAGSMTAAGSLASMASFISAGTAATLPDANHNHEHSNNTPKSGQEQGADKGGNDGRASRRRSKRERKTRRSRTSTGSRGDAQQAGSAASAPSMMQVVAPTQLLVLTTRAE